MDARFIDTDSAALGLTHECLAAPDEERSVRLELRLFGPGAICLEGRPVRPRGAAALALLALLALRGPRTREQLAAELWPDAGTESAAWLRQGLWQLRTALGPDADRVIEVGADRLEIRPHVDLRIDVQAFEASVRARPTRPDEAVALYAGELLDGAPFDCFARDRERLADLYEDALAALGTRCLRDGDAECARTAATALIERDPLREEGHATLMAVYALDGARSRVHRQYLRLRLILDRELGVEPLPETERSYRAALSRVQDQSARRAQAGWVTIPGDSR